jgi:hypothetical protein
MEELEQQHQHHAAADMDRPQATHNDDASRKMFVRHFHATCQTLSQLWHYIY